LRCCGRDFEDYDRVINLPNVDNKFYRNIRIINNCPVCGALLAELQYYNPVKEHFEYIKPERKHVAEWIRVFERENYVEKLYIEDDSGSNSDMNWVSGRQTRKSQFAIDFNGVERLVRTSDPKVFEDYRAKDLLYFINDLRGKKTLVKKKKKRTSLKKKTTKRKKKK
jgi:hypothetical protein